MTAGVKRLLAGLLGSKKFSALLMGLVVSLTSYPLVRWVGMDPTEAQAFAGQVGELSMAGVMAYLVGQGLSDMGKEAKKIEKEVEKVVKDADK